MPSTLDSNSKLRPFVDQPRLHYGSGEGEKGMDGWVGEEEDKKRRFWGEARDYWPAENGRRRSWEDGRGNGSEQTMARLLRSGRGCSSSSCDGDRRRRSRRVQQHDDSSRSVRECSNKKGEKKREQREQSVCPGPVRLSVCSVRPCARAIQTLSFPFLSLAWLSFRFFCFPSSRRWKEKPGWKGRLRAQSGNVRVLLVRHWGAAKQSARWDERTVLCGTHALFPCAPIAVPHAPHEIRPRPNNGGFSPRPTTDEWMNDWMDDKWLDGWTNERMDGMLYRAPSVEVW